VNDCSGQGFSQFEGGFAIVFDSFYVGKGSKTKGSGNFAMRIIVNCALLSTENVYHCSPGSAGER
jgi:hypothetical protein